MPGTRKYNEGEIRNFYKKLVGKTVAQRLFLTRLKFGISRTQLLFYIKTNKVTNEPPDFYYSPHYPLETKRKTELKKMYAKSKRSKKELYKLTEYKQRYEKCWKIRQPIITELARQKTSKDQRRLQAFRNSIFCLAYITIQASSYFAAGFSQSAIVFGHHPNIKYTKSFSLRRYGLEYAILLALDHRHEYFTKHPHPDYNPETGFFKQDVV